jgi:hypothetical protein
MDADAKAAAIAFWNRRPKQASIVAQGVMGMPPSSISAQASGAPVATRIMRESATLWPTPAPDGGNPAAIREAAVRASAAWKPATECEPGHLDEYPELTRMAAAREQTARDNVETISAYDPYDPYDPLPDSAYHGMPKFPALPKVADTAHVGERSKAMNPALAAPYGQKPPLPTITMSGGTFFSIESVEWLNTNHLGIRLRKAEDPLEAAVRKLVGKLPVGMGLHHYFAREELEAVRKILGDR